MLILGIDPGSIKTGFAVVDCRGRKFEYIDSGVLKYNEKVSFIDRLEEIADRTLELIENFSPDEIAIESLIFVKSPTALIKLAQTRGVILSHIVKTHRGRIFEYPPNVVKSSTTGHGHASKESVQKFLSMMTGVQSFKTDDESDALAIALCHAMNRDNSLKANHNSSLMKRSKRGLASNLRHLIKE